MSVGAIGADILGGGGIHPPMIYESQLHPMALGVKPLLVNNAKSIYNTLIFSFRQNKKIFHPQIQNLWLTPLLYPNPHKHKHAVLEMEVIIWVWRGAKNVGFSPTYSLLRRL